jgi:uncharacterized membrane protein
VSSTGAARLRAATILATLLGAGVAGYLTYVHYAELEPLCVGGGDGCERVQSSDQSELLGVPVAVVGLANYLIIAACLLPAGRRLHPVAAGLALAGFGFSLYLTYVELFVIEAICQWCLANAVIATVLAALTVALVAVEPVEPEPG